MCPANKYHVVYHVVYHVICPVIRPVSAMQCPCIHLYWALIRNKKFTPPRRPAAATTLAPFAPPS